MRAAVLGYPIAHSLSPALHNAAYRALGLDWTYEAIPCGEDELGGVLAARTEWAGFSCTMPLKRAALGLAVERSDAARAVRAANTLLPIGDGQWRADNTDVDGVLGALAGAGLTFPLERSVTIIGAGGTAQAAIVALERLGVLRSAVLVRDTSRVGELNETANSVTVGIRPDVLTPDSPALDADLIISTLPSRAADPLADRTWRAEQTLLDVVYAPWPTALAAAATDAGATVVGGAEMLLHQAARQVELMTGCPAPLADMRAALP